MNREGWGAPLPLLNLDGILQGRDSYLPISWRRTLRLGSSPKASQQEGYSPVRGQGRGRGRRSQGFPCGLVKWGLGCFPCG